MLEDAAHGIVTPGLGSDAVAHSRAAANRITVCQRWRSCGTAGKGSAVVPVFHCGRRAVVEALLGEAIDGIVRVALCGAAALRRVQRLVNRVVAAVSSHPGRVARDEYVGKC